MSKFLTQDENFIDFVDRIATLKWIRETFSDPALKDFILTKKYFESNSRGRYRMMSRENFYRTAVDVLYLEFCAQLDIHRNQANQSSILGFSTNDFNVDPQRYSLKLKIVAKTSGDNPLKNLIALISIIDDETTFNNLKIILSAILENIAKIKVETNPLEKFWNKYSGDTGQFQEMLSELKTTVKNWHDSIPDVQTAA